VAVGDTSLPQSVSLTNYGTSTLNITSIIASADFSETDTCSGPLAPEASCTVTVTFRVARAIGSQCANSLEL